MAYAYANDDDERQSTIEITLPPSAGGMSGRLTVKEAKMLLGDLRDAIAQAEDNNRYNALSPNERLKEMMKNRGRR